VQDEFAHEQPPAAEPGSGIVINLLLVLAGLAALVVGADWFVESAKVMARAFGVSELVIGLTIVAAGTSLPEVATSIVASIKGERDIAVGNVVGSNIFNILGVLGISAGISGSGIAVAPDALSFDIPVMAAVAFACLPIFFAGKGIARWEGAVFLGYYVAYTAYLILHGSQHAALATFSHAMLYYVVPLTVLTLLVTTTRAIRAGRLVDPD
jgi:cation:H+ antiporter